MPKTYGVRRHPLFFLSPTFWGCRKGSKDSQVKHVPTPARQTLGRNSPTKTDDGAEIINEVYKFETALINSACYERLGPEYEEKEISQEILKVDGLKKEYENGFKAVNGLNVKMYSD